MVKFLACLIRLILQWMIAAEGGSTAARCAPGTSVAWDAMGWQGGPALLGDFQVGQLKPLTAACGSESRDEEVSGWGDQGIVWDVHAGRSLCLAESI